MEAMNKSFRQSLTEVAIANGFLKLPTEAMKKSFWTPYPKSTEAMKKSFRTPYRNDRVSQVLP
jgi:hypothetical protein